MKMMEEDVVQYFRDIEKIEEDGIVPTIKSEGIATRPLLLSY